MRTFVLTLFIVMLWGTAKGQDSIVIPMLDKNYYLLHHDSLRAAFGKNKLFDAASEPACLAALSFYPELKDVAICFRRHPIRTTMSAVPDANFIYFNKKDRRYFININNRRQFKGIRFDSLSFNQQAGVIGHELGHILYYARNNNAGIILFGAGYLFRDYRKVAEMNTDITTIDHQLGWQLYDYEHHLATASSVSASYKKFRSRFYLNHNELLKIILQVPNKKRPFDKP